VIGKSIEVQRRGRKPGQKRDQDGGKQDDAAWDANPFSGDRAKDASVPAGERSAEPGWQPAAHGLPDVAATGREYPGYSQTQHDDRDAAPSKQVARPRRVIQTVQHMLGHVDWRLTCPQKAEPAANLFVLLEGWATVWATVGVGPDCLRFVFRKPAEDGGFKLTGRRMVRGGRHRISR